MFSSAITNLLNTSGIDSAQSRMQQLETIVAEKTKELEAPSEFNKVLESQNNKDLNFKILPPPPASRGYINSIIEEVSQKYNVDPKLIKAIIKQESGFKADAVSGAGAQGLMQLMPATARKLGVTNPFDPMQNITGGTKYIKGLLDRFNGNLVLAIAAYNAGPNAVKKYDGVPPYKETQNYVKKILSNYLG